MSWFMCACVCVRARVYVYVCNEVLNEIQLNVYEKLTDTFHERSSLMRMQIILLPKPHLQERNVIHVRWLNLTS